MRLALLLIALLYIPAAFAQFWPMQNQAGYSQVPANNYGFGYGYGYNSVYRPIFQQPGFSLMPGYPPPYAPMMPPMFPPMQPMGPFQMSPFPGTFGPSPFGFQPPGINLGLNFNLDQIFGGGAPFSSPNVDPYSSWPAVTDAAPICEECERRRAERIRLDEERDYDEPDYHTEARARYVRQASSMPQTYLAPQSAPPPPPAAVTSAPPPPPAMVDPGGERIAGAEPGREIVLRDGRRLPPAASPQPRPNPGVVIQDPRSGAQLKIRVHAANHDERLAQNAPIWNLFITNFKACAPDCEPVNYMSYGGRPGPSCHPRGWAIDLFAMQCSDSPRPHRAIDNDYRWQKMIACMGGVPGGLNVRLGVRNPRMGVIWRQPLVHNTNTDHWNHAHFSPPHGCGGGQF